jgi:PAS domain S-box-containing protein
MASTSDLKRASPFESPLAESRERPSHGFVWFKSLLDWFLSSALRDVPPSELYRHRLLVGFTLFSLAFALGFMLSVPFTRAQIPMVVSCVFLGVTLLLARRARSFTVPATLLCTTGLVGLLVSVFVSPYPEGGFHAASMLIPSLAVYILGPRPGLLFTLVGVVFLGLVHPLYREHLTVYTSGIPWRMLSAMHGSAAVALLGSWVLSSLHSSSHDVAEAALERALKTLRESEGKLVSLVESTEDLVFSLDRDKRVITANAAMRQLFFQWRGQQLLPGHLFLSSNPHEIELRWWPLFDRVLEGQRMRFEEEYGGGAHHRVLDVSMSPILDADGTVTGLTFFGRDVTARKVAELRLGEMHRSLLDVSRYAGMAEVATGVLHNVGNTLNSVNISTGILSDQLRHSRVPGLRKAAGLLREHIQDLSTFLTQDPRGRQLPNYLLALAEALELERQGLREEVVALTQSVDHIKSIVSMQQQYARATGVVERLPVPQLIEEALRLHAVSFERDGILVTQTHGDVPPIPLDRHKLLQILVNLLSNARHALMESATLDKQLHIRTQLNPAQDALLIEVADNGVGILPEHHERLFTQGFTTKKSGHGFGLHISALAATEMGGRLTCTSVGPGQGATFSLLLPVAGPQEQSAAG